jgi:hypothetical protein
MTLGLKVTATHLLPSSLSRFLHENGCPSLARVGSNRSLFEGYVSPSDILYWVHTLALAIERRFEIQAKLLVLTSLATPADPTSS